MSKTVRASQLMRQAAEALARGERVEDVARALGLPVGTVRLVSESVAFQAHVAHHRS